MKAAKIICCLMTVILHLFAYEACGNIQKHRKPGPDEIERVINATHSTFWKCSMLQCPIGHGATVPCASSVSISTPIKCIPCIGGVNFSDSHDYTTCKSCQNCDKHEKKSGECTPESDTTKCLGTCHKGFYMDKISGGCHPCSDCCGQDKKHHEEQCENSNLPWSMQCRENNFECPEQDTKDTTGKSKHKGGLKSSTIVGIVLGPVCFLLVVGVIFFIYRFRSGSDCLSSPTLDMSFHSSENHFQNSEFDPELGTGKREIHFAETTGSTPKIGKKPFYQRMQSVPVETMQEPVKKIPRSRSHPGALPKLIQKPKEESDLGQSPSQPFRSPRTHKYFKQGYNRLPTSAQDGHDVEGTPKISLQFIDIGEQQSRLDKQSTSTSTSTTGLFDQTATFPKISDIPQDFLKSLLRKKVATIRYQFYYKICQKLDVLQNISWSDYRLLGEKVGVDKDAILWLKQMGNQTEEILRHFDSKRENCVERFKTILEEMGRDDVITVIENWILFEWQEYIRSQTVRPQMYV